MIKGRVKKIKPKSLVVGTNIFNDVRLPLAARGLFCTALSLAQNKGFLMEDLLNSVPDDPDDVYKVMMKLRQLGYCKRVKIDGDTVFQFREKPSRKASRVLKNKNKSSLIYSKSKTHTTLEVRKQSSESGDTEFAGWDEITIDPVDSEPMQLSFLPEKLKRSKPISESVPKSMHRLLHRICFLVENDTEALTLTSRDRGRVASALGKLRDIKADLTQLNRFEDWWNGNWRSKDRVGGYNPPSPEQIVQFWVQAMKHNSYKPQTHLPKHETPMELDLTSIMRDKAETRRQGIQ